MGKNIDINNLIVDTELSIWETGLSATIQNIIESYLIDNYLMTSEGEVYIKKLSDYIAHELKLEQSNRQIFDISTHVDHYRADTI